MPVVREQKLIASLFRVLDNQGYICGGFARWAASPNPNPVPYSDIDIYCRSLSEHDAIKARLLSQNLIVEFTSEIATTFKPHSFGWLQTPQTLQLIRPVRAAKIVTYGNLYEILNDFDFSVVRAGICSTSEVLVDRYFAQDERGMLLRLQNASCPLGQLLRIGKYHKKGYYVPESVYLQVLQAWSSLPEVDRKEIAESLNMKHLPDPGKPNPDLVKLKADECEGRLVLRREDPSEADARIPDLPKPYPTLTAKIPGVETFQGNVKTEGEYYRYTHYRRPGKNTRDEYGF